MKRHFFLFFAISLLLLSCNSSKEILLDASNYNQTTNNSTAKVTSYSSNKKVKPIDTKTSSKPKKIETQDWGKVDLINFFNDAQKLQLSAARVNGIEPMQDNSNFFPLVISGKVIKITSCDEYVLANLSHSYPYLVPKAAEMVKAIGARVQEITGTKTRMLVTSCLRTVEKQMDLSETNQNAASFSCHYYGTTFDLAYNAAGELKGGISYETFFNALCQAVHEFREEGRIYVKYETGQHCLHMTVRP